MKAHVVLIEGGTRWRLTFSSHAPTESFQSSCLPLDTLPANTHKNIPEEQDVRAFLAVAVYSPVLNDALSRSDSCLVRKALENPVVLVEKRDDESRGVLHFHHLPLLNPCNHVSPFTLDTVA